MGKNLLISFSGGETSGYMAQWLKYHAHEHGFDNLVYVFANTGLENEETLKFAKRCDDKWNLNLQWIETVVHHEQGKGSTYRFTDYYSASRNGEPFEEMIKKYGIPNQAFPHCTRETKQVPINKFAKDWFKGEEYWTAIGIRVDEIDRINAKRKQNKLIYPLAEISMQPMTKQKINFWWKQQDFRLELKGYQGNCVTCWKKSDKKLYTIANENPNAFDFMDRMERKYPRVGHEFTKEGVPYQVINNEYLRELSNYKIGDFIYEPTGSYDEDGEPTYIEILITKIENKIRYANDRVFFRGNRTAQDIIKEANDFNEEIRNDAIDFNIQTDLFENESCEVFSTCGIDN